LEFFTKLKNTFSYSLHQNRVSLVLQFSNTYVHTSQLTEKGVEASIVKVYRHGWNVTWI